MTIPTWLPNWKNSDEYPNPKNTIADQWAWEFLRRNPEYQEDLLPLVKDDKTDFSAEVYCRPSDYQLAEKYGFWSPMIYNPAEPFNFNISFLDIYPMRKSYDDTSKEGTEQIHEEMKKIPDVHSYNFDRDPLISEHPREVVLKFNLELSLKEQLKRAAQMLNNERDKLEGDKRIVPVVSRKQNPELYVIYLRILDADTFGASKEEIIKTLYLPNKKNGEDLKTLKETLKNQQRAARKMRDEGYAGLHILSQDLP